MTEYGEFLPPPPRGTLQWAAIDFDGTIAESCWSIDNQSSDCGKPIESGVRKLNDCRAQGYKIVIHTSRAWTDYEIIEAWLKHYGIHFDKIVCGKLLAHMYVDDRGVHASEDVWELPVDLEDPS